MIAFGLFILCAVDLGLFWVARRLQVAARELEKGQLHVGWAFFATVAGFGVFDGTG